MKSKTSTVRTGMAVSADELNLFMHSIYDCARE